MAEFLCNQLYQHLILMDGAAIYAPVKYTYLPTKTLPSGGCILGSMPWDWSHSAPSSRIIPP